MSMTLGLNISALSAQRMLGNSTQALTASYERLSSGLRINHASDDAAGLAISSSLTASSRIYSQGIRNLNDGLSLFNIAEGGLAQLNIILQRLGELAQEAANGTYSLEQRQSMNTEASALTDEYNRIIQSTKFNQRTLFDKDFGLLTLQAGQGEGSQLSFLLNNELRRAVGDGSYESQLTLTQAAGSSPYGTITGDFNGDGNLDIATGLLINKVSIQFGNGDGTFNSPITYSTSSGADGVYAADLNGDGALDLVSTGFVAGTVEVLLNNGNGTFKASSSYTVSARTRWVNGGDFNGDGILDLVSAEDTGTVSILLGNGNGSFKARTSITYATGSPYNIQVSDINGDGKLDLVTADEDGCSMSILLGNGNGTFSARTSFVSGVAAAIGAVSVGDLNQDGIPDIVAIGNSTIEVYIGNGDGTFKGRTSLGSNTGSGGVLDDMNGDGLVDLVVTDFSDGTKTSVYLGNGDGSFKAGIRLGGDNTFSVATGDFNNDGVKDIVATNFSNGTNAVFIANTTETTTLQRLSLNTQADARATMGVIAEALNRVQMELGAIGGFQSRTLYAANNLQTAKLNMDSAASQISDVDMALESSNLVRAQILQRSGVAVLAQANIAPLLALDLLRS